MESDLFFEGMRPAVNVGLSVSRVGSAAQTKAMKKAAGSIRVDLAQYREMAVFTQFASDLDETTKKQLAHGNVLMELLKQPLEHPIAMHDQVIILVAVGSGRMDMIPIKQVKDYKNRLLTYFNTEQGDICQELIKGKDMSEQLKRKIIDAVDAFNDIENKKLKDEIEKMGM